MVYGDRSQHPANQGDLFQHVTLEGSWEKKATVMLISHDCDCDKYLTPNTPLTETERHEWRVTVAEVHPISLLHPNHEEHARKDRMPRYLPLPASGGLPELVVDLWTEQPIRFRKLLECERIASLSPEWRVKLWSKIIRLRLGKEFKQIIEGNVPPDAA